MALSGRTFGVEIEAFNIDSHLLARTLNATPGIDCKYEGYTHRTTPHWKVVTDSSLNGNHNSFELVSPVFSGDDGIAQILAACEVLEKMGAKVNTQCGIHVHFGMRDTTIRQRRNVCAAYARSEVLIDRLMPNSRRGDNSYYARSLVCAGETGTECLERIKVAETHSELCSSLYYGTTGACERYHKINAKAAFDTHGTFEFRQHGGSTDGLKITSWVKFLDALIRDACESPDIRPWNEGVTLKFSKLLMRIGLDSDTRKYLIKREREVNASTDSANAEETHPQLAPARPVRRRVNRNAPVTTPVPAVPEEISVTVIRLLTPAQRDSITEAQRVARRNSWYLLGSETRQNLINDAHHALIADGRGSYENDEICRLLGLSLTGMSAGNIMCATGLLPATPRIRIGYLTPSQREQLTEEMRRERRAHWFAMTLAERNIVREGIVLNWTSTSFLLPIDFCTQLGVSTEGMTAYDVLYAHGTPPESNPNILPISEEENYILPSTYITYTTVDDVARNETEHVRFGMLMRTEATAHSDENSHQILVRAQRDEDLFYMRRRSIHSALANRSDEFYTGLFQHNELFRAYFYGTNTPSDERYRLNLRATVTESPELPEFSSADLPPTYQYSEYNPGNGDYDGVERTTDEWNRYREIHGDLLVNHAGRYAGGVNAWQELAQDVSAVENLFQRRQDIFRASHPGLEQYREFFATYPYFSMYATSAGAVYADNLLEGYFRNRDREQNDARELAELLP